MDTSVLVKMLEKPLSKKVDMVLDTDAYNEIDDQFAIAYMLANSQKLNVKAICAAPFFNGNSASPGDGMEKSFTEIEKLLAMANRSDIPVYKGSERFLTGEGIPERTQAAERIAALAEEYASDNPLYVVAIGAITNVASAILINPGIINKIVVVWLGGHALHWHDTKEFNLYQDVAAARVVFGCGVPLVQLPCNGVVSSFTVSEAELRKWLMGKNEIGTYLAQNTIYAAEVYASGKPWTRVIWDVTAIAWLLDGDFLRDRFEKSPIPEYDGHYAYDCNRHLIKYVYSVNRDALTGDLFEKITSL